MRTVDLIIKKKNGGELTADEIRFLISGYVNNEIPDYQMSSLLMAICFRGLNPIEQFYLTEAMMDSGEKIDLSMISGICVDKHSTGGVGDKTTLSIAPILAACGLKLAKMSGRGLGHTGGTLDKLESIPGFRIDLSNEEFLRQIQDISLAVVGQTAKVAVADKKLYALRDVTGTIDAIGLIASSIMSKKLASGADYILLDVKVGSGAFMKDLASARILAKSMVEIGHRFGKKTVAILTNMNQPLGEAVGNSLEVIEALEMLKGRGPADFKALCYALASELLIMTDIVPSYDKAQRLIDQVIADGAALERFREMVRYQAGNPDVVFDYSLFPQTKYQIEVISEVCGYVAAVDALAIGQAAMQLGAGRKTKDDCIDSAVGIKVKAKVGCNLQRGDALAVIYTNGINDPDLIEEVQRAFTIIQEKVESEKIVIETVY
ncbi:MAG: pyrimidine-nucleoside phosphorylase [Bacilli bacterium]|nr:pyrimidine-nucleoside phosphorylase [Bacilli bacterium]MDD4077743.1 pyrimidine-nucleoside phosphorylase [Bacilli bacterium]MDD4388064.1 pyrimidine-nucleoside phosphorylase [Bacilli bacterium]